MRKIILSSLVAVSTMFAGNANDIDLLSQATAGKVSGTKLAMGAKEASDVKAGFFFGGFCCSLLGFGGYYYNGGTTTTTTTTTTDSDYHYNGYHGYASYNHNGYASYNGHSGYASYNGYHASYNY